MRSILFGLLCAFGHAAPAAVQKIACAGEYINVEFSIPQKGRVTSAYAKNSLKRVGDQVVLTGQDRVASLNYDEGSATTLTFSADNLGRPGPFEARGEYCTVGCGTEQLTCTSVVE